LQTVARTKLAYNADADNSYGHCDRYYHVIDDSSYRSITETERWQKTRLQWQPLADDVARTAMKCDGRRNYGRFTPLTFRPQDVSQY